MIYMDHAATSRLSQKAWEAMTPFMLEQYANASQPYSFSRSVKKAIRESKELIASVIGAEPEEIIITSGGTESDNWAVKEGILKAGGRNEILTSAIEHHAILHSVEAMVRQGVATAQYLPVNQEGVLTPQALKTAMSDRTGLVSIMLSNNEVGTIEPIRELAEIAHEGFALFHTDAVQSVGHIEINVKKLGVDMLSASAHKFNGPKGIGFLYLQKDVSLPSFHSGGAQEMGRRAGTEDTASIVGMAVALQEHFLRMKEEKEHLLELEKLLLGILDQSGMDYIRNGAKNHVPGNISLSFKGAQGEMLLHRLDLMGICVSTGSACDSKNTQISHVLQAMNVPAEYAYGTIRISLGAENTKEEVEKTAHALVKILQ